MEQIIIDGGESRDISVYNVHQTMQQTQSSYAQLTKHWKGFCRNLGIPEVKVISLEQKLNIGLVQTEDVIREILDIWKAEQGKKATLKTIFDALCPTGIKDIAECLAEVYCETISTSTKYTNVIYTSEGQPIKLQETQFQQEEEKVWQIVRDETCRCGKERAIYLKLTPLYALTKANLMQRKLRWLPDGTQLHVAANRGCFDVLKELLQKYEDKTQFHYLLHACVANSNNDNKRTIEEKLKIIELLHAINSGWIKETLDDCTPLLERNVHCQLLQALVGCGANFNESSETWGTILHRSGDENNFEPLLNWVTENGFDLINFKDGKRGLTPLHHAVKQFGTLGDDVVQKFKESGADFNSTDLSGYPIIFHALMNSDSTNFIEKVINSGCDVNFSQAGPDKINAAHLLCKHVDDKATIDKLKLLKRKDFKLIDQTNGKGETPLDCIPKDKPQYKELREFLAVSIEAKKKGHTCINRCCGIQQAYIIRTK